MRNKPWLKQLVVWSNRYEWLILLLTFALILRLPSLGEPLWYLDENIYLAIGQSLDNQATLYQDITDFPNKPPLIYWFAGLVGHIGWWRFSGLIFQLAAVTSWYLLSKLVFKVKDVILVGAGLVFVFLLTGPLVEGTITNGETFFVPTVIVGLSLMLWSMAKYQQNQKFFSKVFILSGVILGLASLWKFQAWADLVAAGIILIYWLFTRSSKQRRQSYYGAAKLIGGLAVTYLIFGLVWTSLPDQNLITLVRGLSLDSPYLDTGLELTRPATWMGLNSVWLRATWMIGLSLLWSAYLGKYQKKFTWFGVLGFWFIWATFGSLLSGRSYPHYLLQLAAPFSLSLALIFNSWPKNRKPALALTGLIGVIGLIIAQFNFFTYPVRGYYVNYLLHTSNQISTQEYYSWFNPDLPKLYRISDYINQTVLPEFRIYVWANAPQVYVLSKRQPATSVTTYFHTLDLELKQETIDQITTNPPSVIVVDSDKISSFIELQEFIDQNNYTQVLFTDSTEPYRVYRYRYN